MSMIPTSERDYFCKNNHEEDVFRHKLKKTAVDRAARDGGGTIVSIVPMGQVLLRDEEATHHCRSQLWIGYWFIQFTLKYSIGHSTIQFRRSCVAEPFLCYGK